MIKVGNLYKLDRVRLKWYIENAHWSNAIYDSGLKVLRITALAEHYEDDMSCYFVEFRLGGYFLPEDCFKELRTNKLKRILDE